MKVKPLIILFLMLSTSLFGQQADSVKKPSYTLKIKKYRQKKNKEFKNPETSPLTEKQLKTFDSLYYFPVNKKYKVKARLEKKEDTTSFVIPTTTDRKPLYRKYGVAHFMLNGEKVSLTIYRSVRLAQKEKYKDYLFVPFMDLTNGETTYGGGRYIDSKIKGNRDTIVLDFNKAYNPYCAYHADYSCPIPPQENHLDIKINAGEKAFD